jgi:hypothetical protein
MKVISSILLGLLYFQSVFSKNLSSTPKTLQMKLWKWIPFLVYQIVIAGVMLLEFLGPLVIVYSAINDRFNIYGQYAIVALITFTILAMIIYHKFGSGQFYFHLAIIGGLLALLGLFRKNDLNLS